jgi:hypothetical protein
VRAEHLRRESSVPIAGPLATVTSFPYTEVTRAASMPAALRVQFYERGTGLREAILMYTLAG